MTMDARVEDFLNDKIQSYTDFESLDLLLSDLSNQHERLRDQLVAAETERRRLNERSRAERGLIEEDVATYTTAQSTMQRSMASIATAIEIARAADAVAPQMGDQRFLKTADEYLQTLIQFDNFGKQAKTSEHAIEAANNAFAMAVEVKQRHSGTHDAAPHLVDCVDQTTTAIRKAVENDLSSALRSIAEKFLWPKPGVELPESLATDLHIAVDRLLQLQTPEIEFAEFRGRSTEIYQPVLLTPFRVLMEPLAVRFAYHFSGNKPTNRIDKPQYFLSHAAEILSTYAGFFTAYLQPVLLKRFSAHPRLNGLSYIDSTTALINAVLPMVDSKLEQIIGASAADPRLLSHLVHETLQFDVVLRSEWCYEPTPTDPSNECLRWRGVTDALLSDAEIFQHWLNAERELALARYESIVADSTASALDIDAADGTCTRPTKAAVKIQDLVAGITYHFRDLPSLPMRLRFLIDIQIAILDRFHSRLDSSLEAYIARTSVLGRAMQSGSSQEVDVRGINGLERLIRVCGSADYFEQSMKSWSDETFFLELWEELQGRARTGEKIGQNLNVSQLAKQTSSSLIEAADASDVEKGAVFDESAAAYKSLRIRAESLIASTICNTAVEMLSPYLRSVSAWSMLPGNDQISAISSDLGHFLRVMIPELTFVVRSMAHTAARKILRAWSKLVEGAFIDSVIYKNSFTVRGIEQLSSDVNAVYDSVSAATAPYGQTMPRSPKLFEALTLLRVSADLDVSRQKASSTDLEKMLLTDGESARRALEQLEMEAISVREARRVLTARANTLSTQ